MRPHWQPHGSGKVSEKMRFVKVMPSMHLSKERAKEQMRVFSCINKTLHWSWRIKYSNSKNHIRLQCPWSSCLLSEWLQFFLLFIAAIEVSSSGSWSDLWLWQPMDRGHFPMCHSSFLSTHVPTCCYWIIAGCYRRWATVLQPNTSIFIPCMSQASFILQSFLEVSEQGRLLGYFPGPHNSLQSIMLFASSSDYSWFLPHRTQSCSSVWRHLCWALGFQQFSRLHCNWGHVHGTHLADPPPGSGLWWVSYIWCGCPYVGGAHEGSIKIMGKH